MKYLAWGVGAAVAVGMLGSVPLGCVSNSNPGSSSDDGGPPLSEDSGQPPGQDATVPSSDAGIDAADGSTPVDAGPQLVTVDVLLGSAPESGILVVFQDVTGALLSTATTGPTGSVSALLAANSQVTVSFGTALAPALVTVTGVAPGDVLTFVDPTAPASDTVGEDVNFTLPTDTWDASSVFTTMFDGNCQTQPGSPLYVNEYCQSGGTFPLLAHAVTADGQELAYTYKTGNAIFEDGGSPSIAVSQPWATSSVIQTLTASALPAGVTADDVQFTYAEISGGIATAVGPTANVEDDAGVRSTFAVHTGFPDFVQLEATSQPVEGSNGAITGIFTATRAATPTVSAATALDLSTLPLISSATINTSTPGSIAQPIVAFTANGSMPNATGVVFQMQWFAAPTDGGNESTQGVWTIFAPGTATSVTAPGMPAGSAPAANAQYTSLPRVVAMTGSLVPSYQAVRQTIGTLNLFPGTTYYVTLPVLPANGNLVLSALFPDEG